VLGSSPTRHPPIIFRDLKPANIMRTPQGDLFLIDFGIARLFKPGKFRDTVAMGSPGYAAPEQFGKAQTDARSDIYSLGVILHQMLSGSDPVQNAVAFSFPPLTQQPAEMQALLHRMLAVDPGARPASADEVMGELQRIAVPWRAEKQPAVAEPTRTRGKGSATCCVYSGHTKAVYTLAWSPNGRRIASAGEDGGVRIWEALTGEEQVCYEGHGSWVMGVVAWSPGRQAHRLGGSQRDGGCVERQQRGARALLRGRLCSRWRGVVAAGTPPRLVWDG
jgi:eukaryotic-like serine/threonine-protein kinase